MAFGWRDLARMPGAFLLATVGSTICSLVFFVLARDAPSAADDGVSRFSRWLEWRLADDSAVVYALAVGAVLCPISVLVLRGRDLLLCAAISLVAAVLAIAVVTPLWAPAGALAGFGALASAWSWCRRSSRRALLSGSLEGDSQSASPPRRFSWRHLRIAIWVYAGIGGAILMLTRSFLYSAEVLLGPFAGAAAREWESGFVDDALGLFAFAGPALAIGALVQVLVPATSSVLRTVRFVVWGLAVGTWFLFAVYSYGSALE